MLGLTKLNHIGFIAPILMVFFSIQSNCRITPELLDLSKPACKDKIVSHENPAKWDIHDIQELWSGVAVAPWEDYVPRGDAMLPAGWPSAQLSATNCLRNPTTFCRYWRVSA